MALGVLLMNTGTPDEPSIDAIRAYLREFLSDSCIIGTSTPLHRLGVFCASSARPRKTLPNYQAFWTPEGSPFMLACQKQAELLQESLRARLDEEAHVVLAMRYGNPGIAAGLEELRSRGVDQLVLLPAYPQQVRVCAGTCLEEANRQLAHLEKDGWHPQTHEVSSFFDLPSYRAALAQSVTRAWQWKPGAKLLVSSHSTLMRDIDHGDPYRDQLVATCDNLAVDLDIPREDVLLAYQSRFDSRKWLAPFTEATVKELAATGVRDLCVVCPIFTATNIETVQEVGQGLRATYLEACGEPATFTHVPELDADPALIEALGDAVLGAIARWDQPAPALSGRKVVAWREAKTSEELPRKAE